MLTDAKEALIMSADKPLYVEKEFEVRTYDIDFASVVGNIVYIRWLEDFAAETPGHLRPAQRSAELRPGPHPDQNDHRI